MKTLLCYGDSNTHGFPPVPWPDSRFDLKDRWTGVLARSLGDEWRIIEEGLGGRTTVHDDPIEGDFKNGKRYLLPCLLSHRPVDVMVLMLGTNDLKARFTASCWEITEGIRVLVEIARTSGTGRSGGIPDLLLVAPTPIRPVLQAPYDQMFAGAYGKSLELGHRYAELAEELGLQFLDAGQIIQASEGDGVHLDQEAHRLLGEALARKVKENWTS